MLGSLRWNFATGAAGLLLTFLFSLGDNGLAVSGLRAGYAFIALFLVTFLFRFALFLIVGGSIGAAESSAAAGETVGGTIDVATPADGEDLQELLKAQLEADNQTGPAEFRPLTPTRLVSAQNKEPEELARIVRHLADQPAGDERE